MISSLKSKQMSVADRSFVMNMTWVGLAASLVLLADQLVAPIPTLGNVAAGVVAGSLIAQPLVFRQDEFFQRCASIAARWAICVTGIWLLLSLLNVPENITGDVRLWLAIIGVTYHAAFKFIRFKV